MEAQRSFREEKLQEERSRIQNAIIKSFSRGAICYSVGILFMFIIFAFADIPLEPVKMLKIWIGFFIMSIFSVFRVLLASSRWALRKPFILVNLLFMPLYLVTALILAMDIIKDVEGLPKGWMLIFYAGLFLVVFTVKQLIEYFRYKAKTDLMNDALVSFQKEHNWDEDEG